MRAGRLKKGAGDAGEDSGKCGAQVGWKAGRTHFFGEIDRVCQAEDGEVVVECAWIEFWVVDDLSNIYFGELSVSDVVLSKEHPDPGCWQISTFMHSAMGSG